MVSNVGFSELKIGDRGPNNAITIQGYRDQVEDLLNAFRTIDPNMRIVRE